MTIKYIFTVFSSERDRNGNCEHFAALRSVRTGKNYAWHTHNESNAQHELCAALGVSYLDWNALCYSTQTLGIRELTRYAKQHGASYNNPTRETIEALNALPTNAQTILHALCDSVRDDLLRRAKNWPAEWDGHEVRALLADCFAREVSETMRDKRSKRVRDYERACIASNLRL